MDIRVRLILAALFCFFLNCHRPLPPEMESQAPPIPKIVFPPHDTTDISVNVTFIWSCDETDKKDSVTYDFYLQADNPNPKLIVSKLTTRSYHNEPLLYNTNYYWKVIARNLNGASSTSPIWHFKTRYENNAPPFKPKNLQPANGITALPIETVIMQWQGGDPDSFSIVAYDVYFGKEKGALPLVSPGQADTFFAPGILEFETKYYWKIVAKDHYGLKTEGSIWNFSTEGSTCLFEENFDSYPANGYPDAMAWTIIKSGAEIFITDSIAMNNIGKSICFVDPTEAGNSFLATRLPAQAIGMLQFCWRITTKKDVFGVRLYSQKPGMEYLGPQVSLRDGKIQYYDSNYNWQTVCDVDSNSWYRVQLYFDCQKGYYKIYINEKLIIDHATWIGSSVPTLDLLYFLTFENRTCQRAYLDEIKFNSSSGGRLNYLFITKSRRLLVPPAFD